MVGALGLEPETSAVSKQRSTTELRAHNQGHTAKVCTLVVPHRQKHASLLRKAGVDGAEGGTRTPTSYLTRPSNVRVYQFRHFGSFRDGFQTLNACTFHFLAGDFDGRASMVDVGTATGAFGAGVACVLAAADGDGNGACSGTPDCNTELVPVIIGNESIKANSIKAAAAPIVIFDNNVCVPLGPNAVLDTELENSAPASDFPGWSRTVTTSTMHARINSP